MDVSIVVKKDILEMNVPIPPFNPMDASIVKKKIMILKIVLKERKLFQKKSKIYKKLTKLKLLKPLILKTKIVIYATNQVIGLKIVPKKLMLVRKINKKMTQTLKDNAISAIKVVINRKIAKSKLSNVSTANVQDTKQMIVSLK